MWPFKRKAASPEWSSDPMCFERELARKVGNPLFPASERSVTAAQLKAAKERDEANATSFKKDFEQLVAWGLSFGNRNATADELGEYFKRSLELLETAARIGGSWDVETKVLENAAAASKDLLCKANPQGQDLLERYEALSHMTSGVPLVAQGGAQGPFRGDLAAWLRAVLSEDDWQIEACAKWAGAMGLAILDQANGICQQAVQDGFPSFEARRKLGLLQQAYEEGAKLRENQPDDRPEDEPKQPSSSETAPSGDEAPQKILRVIEDLEKQGKPVPPELLLGAQRVLDGEFDRWFQDFDAVVMKTANSVVDLARFATDFRRSRGWPIEGPLGARPDASDEVQFVFNRIADLNGNVPFREALFMQAVLNSDGPELRYLKERQKRFCPSLYNDDAAVQWSSTPGFYEGHLRRRHHNVLFPSAKRRVSGYDVYIARQLDAEEFLTFEQHWKDIAGKIVHGPDTVAACKATDRLQELYGLLEEAAMIGGRSIEHVNEIRNIYDDLLRAMYDGVRDNPEATKALKAAEELRWAGSAILLNPSVRQILRLPDPTDVVPATLSEDVGAVRCIAQQLQTDVLESVRADVLCMMNESPEVDALLRAQPEKLQQLGIAC